MATSFAKCWPNRSALSLMYGVRMSGRRESCEVLCRVGDRPCWDQSSVLFAVFPDRGYFGLSNPGRVSVANDGFTCFTSPNQDMKGSPRDRFLTMSPTQQARVLEAIVQLTVQPTRK